MSEERTIHHINKEMEALLDAFYQDIDDHLPNIGNLVDSYIDEQNIHKSEIEAALKILLKITKMGKGEGLYIRLLEYYKTINPDRAKDFWKEFDV
ncbi:MAG: hypothetical protein KA797_02400 [Chitinophagales bacterium]|nr:hypothetical protein [Chitinophagales bacterium]